LSYTIIPDNATEDTKPEPKDSSVKISEDVILELATQALGKVIGIKPFSGENGDGPPGGVKITVNPGPVPSVTVDAHITTRYGFRIPDISWYVQEFIKRSLEQNTGYVVSAVNVFVQGVFLE